MSLCYEVDGGVVEVSQVFDELDLFVGVGSEVAVVRQEVRLLVVLQLLDHALADQRVCSRAAYRSQCSPASTAEQMCGPGLPEKLDLRCFLRF